MLTLPLAGIKCRALDENCKSPSLCNIYPEICLFHTCLTCFHCAVTSLRPLSGEYALAEYTEVKAVTIKLNETM